MRRFFTIVAAMALAITVLHAQEPNIYASGLSANTVDNTNQEVQISYTLNAPASSLTIILQKETDPPLRNPNYRIRSIDKRGVIQILLSP
ncbi:hypothetical protein NXX53_26575 [Bacteroides salyersiae]|nr:hypothetical protein [Bacteroides salyersiae]